MHTTRSKLIINEAVKTNSTQRVGACAILATRLAIDTPSPNTNCQKGAPFINTNIEAIPPKQLPTNIDKLIIAKWENRSCSPNVTLDTDDEVCIIFLCKIQKAQL